MGLIISQYRETWDFLRKRIKIPFLISMTLFLIVGVAVYVILSLDQKAAEQVALTISQMFESKGIVVDGRISALRLLVNNLIAAAIAMCTGLTPLFWLPVLSMVSNGAIVGALAAFSVKEVGWGVLLLALLPHGIFELPALFLSSGMGMALTVQLWRIFTRSPKALPFFECIMEMIRLFMLIVFPLLIIASFVEAYITPTLIS